MFAVLETITVPARGGWARGVCRAAVREKPRYVGVTVEMPMQARESKLRRRALRACRTAIRAGASGVVLPKRFPFPGLAESLGLAVSSPVPLLRRLAAHLCRFAVREAKTPWERVRLSFIGRRSTPELLAACGTLSAETRTVYVEAGNDGEAVCYLLRRNYGISAVNRAARPNLGFWDIYILFEQPEQTLRVSENALVLNLTGGTPALTGGMSADGARLEPPRSLWKDWPNGCDDNAMLAALLATGQVSLSDIGILGLTYRDNLLKFPY